MCGKAQLICELPKYNSEKQSRIRTPCFCFFSTADKNLRRVELSKRDFSSGCDLFIRIVLNFNFGFKVLTDRNKRSEML